MAVTAWKNCRLCDSVTAGWYADATLVSPLVGDEMELDDDVFAQYIAGSGTTTAVLRCKDFDFVSELPVSATIDGFEIEFTRLRAVFTTLVVNNTVVRLVKANTTTGSDFGNVADWPTTEAAQTYGGITELGGVAWAYADVIASDFGCSFQAVMNAGRINPPTANLFGEMARMRVYYTAPAPPPTNGNNQVIFYG